LSLITVNGLSGDIPILKLVSFEPERPGQKLFQINRVAIYQPTKHGTEDLDGKSLANLFALTRTLDLEPRIAPTNQRIADLEERVAKILKDGNHQ
jgi:hypothetical protein